MKKILILANNDVGLYKFRKELIQALIEQGHKIYIALPYGKLVEPLKQMGCEFIDTPVDRRGISPITDFKLLLEYVEIMKIIKPDLVLTYTIKPNIYGGLVSRMAKIPYIVNITGLGTAFQEDGLLKKVIISLYRVALKKAKKIFFENEGNKQVFRDSGIIKEKNAVVMNGAGVNLDEYPFTPMPEGKDFIRFLFIGRVMKEKGIDELFEVAKKIKKEYMNIEFDIVGPFEDNYENLVKELQEHGVINYYGYQEDVRPFITQSHCVVLPSYHEGMANVLLEAASMGRPLITTDIYGCREAIEKNVNGYVCQVCSADDLYEKCIKFIELTPLQMKSMGEKSREYIKDKFNRTMVVKRTMGEMK